MCTAMKNKGLQQGNSLKVAVFYIHTDRGVAGNILNIKIINLCAL